MAAWEIVLLILTVLFAALLGLLVPTLMQLRATLKSTQTLIDRVGPQLESTLGEAKSAAERLNRTGDELEQGTKRAAALLHAAGDIGQTLRKINHSWQTAAVVTGAVGPAIVAAVKAFVDARQAADAGETEQETDETAHETETAQEDGENPSRRAEPSVAEASS